MRSFWFVVLLLCSIIGAECFVSPNVVAPRHCANLYNTLGDGEFNEGSSENSGDGKNDDADADASLDIANARKRLESLMSTPGKGTGENGNGEDDDLETTTTTTAANAAISLSKLLDDYDNGVDFSLASLPPPPPLSTVERSRRLLEIGLLECLREGDDAISELWDHWYSERGSTTKLRLEETGGMFLDRSKWKECEGTLIRLVDEYGIYFVEPMNLLATLYFIQKRYDRSFKLCELILSIKPHHVGALSGIVEVAMCRGDVDSVRYWAAKRLPKQAPPPGMDAATTTGVMEEKNSNSNKNPEYPRREEWVERAVAEAKEQLNKAERRTQETFFGKADIYYDNSTGGENRLDDENEDAWQ